MQPQFDIRDYTDRSIVVRANPTDALKQYSGMLTPFSGKWNPGLGATGPSDPNKVPGWIFPKKNEAQIRQLLGQISQGIVSPIQTSPTAPLTLTASLPVIGGSGVTAFPAVGSTVQLDLGNQKFPMVIQSIESTSNGLVQSAVVRLSDGQQARIELETRPTWKIPGFTQNHSVTLI